MRRPLRTSLDAVTVGSSLLCVAVAVLWVRSYRVTDDFSLSDRSFCKSSIGGVVLVRRSEHTVFFPDDDRLARLRQDAHDRWQVAGIERFSVVDYDGAVWTLTGVRYALLATLAVVPLGLRLSAAMMRRRRYAAGRCAGCGYDLRATPGRCPECGREVVAGAGKAGEEVLATDEHG